MLTRKGEPDALQTVEVPFEPLERGQVRVRVLASGVGYTDVMMRRGYYPYAPPLPFVQGYEAVGVVADVGPDVTSLVPGQKVAALLVFGGWGEYVVRPAEDWVPVPEDLDDGHVVALVLNYVTAYQMIHRCARVAAGQTVLVPGATGGIGSALIELLGAAGARIFGAGAASVRKAVEAAGATFVEDRTRGVDTSLCEQVPGGVDVSFDGIGGGYLGRVVRATRRGGHVVAYGLTSAIRKDGSQSLAAVASTYLRLYVTARLRGRKTEFYGITQLYRKDPRPFREDLPKLFDLLAAGRIHPRIHARMPLLEARKAVEQLESGGVQGKIVLVA